ncbi:MAG: GNAT family N-acetyltransferase, partial [Bacteroidales bacterium]|nr:GNAT family N-acetyltransferase [Bacteroidales bacterium]
MSDISFEFCDFQNPQHVEAYTGLLNHYMSDPMGDFPLHDKNLQQLLVERLSKHPTAFVLFILCDGK